MGGKQSRVEASDVETELKHQVGREGETTASINLTPALVAQLNDKSEPKHAPAANGVHLTPEYVARDLHAVERAFEGMNVQQEVLVKKQLQDAYLKGAADFRKDFEAKQKQQKQESSVKTSVVDAAKQAQLAKEQEAKESAKVQRLVDEISRKKYRAPLNDVQCSPERDACLQCYRDKQSDILQCKEVADAFVRCSQQTTEVTRDPEQLIIIRERISCI